MGLGPRDRMSNSHRKFSHHQNEGFSQYHMKVLIVDDDPTSLNIIEKTVSSMGHEAIMASTAEAALECFRTKSVDLIITDFKLPGFSGFEMTRIIREESHHHKWIPIIFMSGLIEDEFLIESIEVGADDYLKKPIKPNVLKVKILAMCRIATMRHELLQAYHTIENMTYLDALTNVLNRRGYDRTIDQEWRRMAREGSSLSLLLIDIDNFKQFNDTYGHLDGDSCLSEIATSLHDSAMRPADTVARYGGEEFVIVLPGTPIVGAQVVADRILKGVMELEIEHAGVTDAEYVTVSIGVSSNESSAVDSPETLFEHADKALYEAKKQGKNRFFLAADDSDDAQDQLGSGAV